VTVATPTKADDAPARPARAAEPTKDTKAAKPAKAAKATKATKAAKTPDPKAPDLRVTQVRSAIGSKPKHRATLRALGLRGIGKTNDLPDRPEIRGMIARVPHLITVEEVSS